LIREHAEALANDLYTAQRQLDELQREFQVRGEVLSYATRRWLEAELQRDKARDLAVRLAANQPVREAPDSLMEAVLGADTGCWYDGPAA
jgi:hypothetical protein